jgi:hypothetical protein
MKVGTVRINLAQPASSSTVKIRYQTQRVGGRVRGRSRSQALLGTTQDHHDLDAVRIDKMLERGNEQIDDLGERAFAPLTGIGFCVSRATLDYRTKVQ